jgi:hypothetical protein
MRHPGNVVICLALFASLRGALAQPDTAISPPLPAGVSLRLDRDGDLRTYTLSTSVALRDNTPPDKRVTFSEVTDHPKCRTGNVLFDALYALAVTEALENSVSQISDGGYASGAPVRLEAFQTGEQWKYVWTRDLSYSAYLALASFDPQRCVNSLLFKTSSLKASVQGGLGQLIIQDTGSGGSYPVSTDRVSWILGTSQTLNYLDPAQRQEFLQRIYPILGDSIQQDRQIAFDPEDGLYRGEQSFLDWREQTYPGWTRNNVLAIAMSKTLSVNALNYYLLKTTAGYARALGHAGDATQYDRWAAELKAAINSHFFDSGAGLYSAYLLTDGESAPVAVARYDLLGESLAIISGVADGSRASSIIANYPVGPSGPPVVWPEERAVPIYHNQAVWPFATAYWMKAAKLAGNAAAIDAGAESLQRLAARNLSNMENFDFLTGSATVENSARQEPVIDSRRQLWSVAGYLSMVQDIVFGLDVSPDGIRFQPAITARLRNETFGAADVIELGNLEYQRTSNLVRIHLPAVDSFSNGFCAIDGVALNGKALAANSYTAPDALLARNVWDIYLKAPARAQAVAVSRIRNIDPLAGSNIFAPGQPRWQGNGITLKNGRLALTYEDDDAANDAFDIYRDGRLYAGKVRETHWVDPLSADYEDTVHHYAVAAVDIRNGNVSHLSPWLAYRTEDQLQVIPAAEMRNRGGNLVSGNHFENWGKSGDELTVDNVRVKRGGRYAIRIEFANGAGPVNTGITCGIKRLEIRDAVSSQIVGSGYIVMPQSGNWSQWDESSAVNALLDPHRRYAIRVFEDEYSRNMSYLKQNERYTAGVGGGDSSYNYVNIAAIHLLFSGRADAGSPLAAANALPADR